jgi:hypothetical protein
MKNAFGVKSFQSAIFVFCFLMLKYSSASGKQFNSVQECIQSVTDIFFNQNHNYPLSYNQAKKACTSEQASSLYTETGKNDLDKHEDLSADGTDKIISTEKPATAPAQSANNTSGSIASSRKESDQTKAIKDSVNLKTGAIYKCVEATDKAKDDCRLDRSDEMKAFLNFGQMMGAMVQASSKQDESYCNKMKNMGDLASSGLSGFKLYCASGYATCSSECDKAKTFLNSMPVDNPEYPEAEAQVKKASKDCGKLTGSLAEAAGYIVVMVQNNANAKQCKQMLGKVENEMCKANKELCDPNAALDCSNPQVAMTNLVCKCKSNPNAEGCNGNVSGLSANNMIDPNGMADTAGLGGGNAKLPSAGGDIPEQYGFPFDGKPSEGKGANLSLGKGGSHGGGLPGGGGGGAPAGKPGHGGSNLNAGILNGWQGGRGNQGGWGNTGGGWGDGNKAAAANGKNPYMTVDKNGNPVDLRQFLPGQNMDATRGIAGISGPDGITGPNSSLWQKVRVRYSSQRNFMP